MHVLTDAFRSMLHECLPLNEDLANVQGHKCISLPMLEEKEIGTRPATQFRWSRWISEVVETFLAELIFWDTSCARGGAGTVPMTNAPGDRLPARLRPLSRPPDCPSNTGSPPACGRFRWGYLSPSRLQDR